MNLEIGTLKLAAFHILVPGLFLQAATPAVFLAEVLCVLDVSPVRA